MPKTAPTFRYAIATLIAVTLLIMGAALLLGLVSIDRPLPPIDTAVSATATITNSRIKPGEMSTGKFPRRSSDRFFVSVAFVVSDSQMEAHEMEVDQAYFDANMPGRQVTVWYFPDRPQVTALDGPSELAETGSRWGQLLGWVLVVIGTCGGVTFGNRLIAARTGYSVL